MQWLRNNPGMGPKEIQQRLTEKYGVEVPYSRCYFGKELALDKMFGKYSESFSLIYSFKAKVERTSPGSVVEIDKHSRPKVKEYLEEHHTKIWARALFNDTCKVDYVNNNLAEAFNSRIKKIQGASHSRFV